MSASAASKEAVVRFRVITLDGGKLRFLSRYGRLSRLEEVEVEYAWPSRVDGSAGLRRTPVAIDVEKEMHRVVRMT
jgi:hypothetical protein